MYVPAGIALEKLYQLAGFEILVPTGELDLQLALRGFSQSCFITRSAGWVNDDQLKA